MNSDTIQGDWTQFKGKLREMWGDLTDSDLDRYQGKKDQLTGMLQKKYGLAKEEVERKLSDCNCSDKC
jgi:uncharacterized protein YjbJ (UPF0337 family)